MVSENLYLVKRTFTDLKTPAEITYNVSIPAAFTDLKAAKDAARGELIQEGYEKAFFPVWHVNNSEPDWPHGDGVMVFAEGPSHEAFKVEIETVPNLAKIEADESGRIRRPLHYVLQTIIYYNEESSGAKRETIVEGVHVLRELARAQASKILLGREVKKEDFAAYNEYSAIDAEKTFGDDVVVHAVKPNGENILVSVISNYSV